METRFDEEKLALKISELIEKKLDEKLGNYNKIAENVANSLKDKVVEIWESITDHV